MKKLILFLTLLFVGIGVNAQYSPSNNLNYIKLLKVPPTGSVEDSVMVYDGSDSFVKMVPSTALPVSIAVQDSLAKKLNISDLPANLTLYPTTTASDVGGYVVLVKDIHDPRYNSTAVDVSTPAITGTAQLISQRISDAGVLTGNPGVFNVTTYGNIRKLSGSGTAQFYFEVYHRDSAGTETLICTSSVSGEVVNGTYAEFSASGVWDNGAFSLTDRIVTKTYANRISGGSDPVYQLQFGGTSPVRTVLPVPFTVLAGEYEIKANKQNSLAVDGTGGKYPTVDAVNEAIAEVTPEMFGAVGDGVTDDATEIQDAIDFLETNGGALRLKSGSAYRINSTIILPSNITIIGYGAKVELGANSVQMFVTKGFVGGARTENIAFLGGTYDGGTYSGSFTNSYRFIFHKSDRITIKDVNFLSEAESSYMVTLADTKDAVVENCSFITAKDGVHLVGKNYNTKIQNIYGVAGDDLIAVTTKDYAGIDFEEGDVQGLYIKNIVCDNATRAVLLGNTLYTIKDVYIDNVEQLGTGALMNIGDAGTSETGVLVDNVIIKNTKVNNANSQLLLKHRNLGKITIENTNAEIYVGREEAFGFANIDHLIVNKGTALFMEEHVVISRVIELSGMTQKIQIGGTTDLFSLKNSTISTTSNLVAFTGLTKNALISNCILKSSYTGNDATLFFKDTINNVVVENSELQSGSTLSPLFLGNDSNSIINKLTYSNCKINQVSRIYNTNYVGTGNTEINISNTNITNANRLVEDSSNVEFVIKYDNINIGTTLNRPFNFYNSQVVSVYGNGYQGTSDTFDSNSNVLCYAQDFPINVGAISSNNKSRAYNTNAGLSCGVGLVANDGTGWYNIANGASNQPITPSKIKITTTPTASAESFLFLTYNATTDEVEQVASDSVLTNSYSGANPFSYEQDLEDYTYSLAIDDAVYMNGSYLGNNISFILNLVTNPNEFTLNNGTNTSFKGITYENDLSANYDDNSLVQKVYVDKITTFKGAYSTTATAATSFTVPIGQTMANTNYVAVPVATNMLSAVLFSVQNKTTTTFDIVVSTGLTGAISYDFTITP